MASPLEIVKSWEVGQLAAVVSKLGEENAKKILTCDNVTVKFDQKKAVVQATPSSQTFLGFSGDVLLPGSDNRFDPETFKTGDGLFVWDDFVKYVRSVAQPVDSCTPTSIATFDLVRKATDTQIRSELPADHVFEDASTFCAYLAGMVKQRPGGAEGSLLNNGYANIFYVRGITGDVVAVDVSWLADARLWLVVACALDDSQWHAGSRVFSRTAVV